MYESPHALVETLGLISEVFGNRKISLCREMTKLNEDIMRTTLAQALEYYAKHQPRGEYVLVVEGLTSEEMFWSNMTVADHVRHYLSMDMSKMDAIKQTAKDRGVGKNAIYKEIIDEDI